MKKLKSVSILFILLCVFSNIQGQSTVVFPDSNAIWRDYSWWMGPCNPSNFCTTVDDFQYSIKGDTIIQGVAYSKLYLDGGWRHHFDVSSTTTIHDSTYFNCAYYGALRWDSLEHVYFIPSISTNEWLFYDFSLSAGDTLPLSLQYATYFYNVNIVKSVDSILVAAQYHKRLNVCTTTDTSTFISLIEGIGSTHGLFGSLVIPTYQCWYTGSLICFYSDSVNVFSSLSPCASPTPQVCNLYSCSSPNEIESINEDNSVHIFPSPVNDYINIEVNNYNWRGNITTFIIDETGRIIIKEKSCNRDFRINTSNIKPGLYLIRLMKDYNFIAQRRFIKL